MYRVNKKGGYNVPIGKTNVNWENNFNNLRSFSKKIKLKKIKIENLSYTSFFEKYSKNMTKDDLVYLDPPYYDTFVSYDGHGFSIDDQINLCEICSKLGCHVVASNSNTEFIKKLYEKNIFEIEEVDAYRHINSDAAKRGKQSVEVICTKLCDG
jgi:DNA adenine methylase